MPWQFYLALVLSIGTIVLVVLRLRAETAGRTDETYIYRPATMLVIAIMAMIAPEPVSVFYKSALVLGLLLALVGEAVAMIRGTPTIVPVIFVSLVVLLYLLGFGSAIVWGWPSPWALLIPLVVAAAYWVLAPFLGEFWFPSILFMALLAVSTWLALELFVTYATPWAAAALFGMGMLDCAALVLGLREFRGGFRGATLLLVTTYLIGQWLIAVSVWGGLHLPWIGI